MRYAYEKPDTWRRVWSTRNRFYLAAGWRGQLHNLRWMAHFTLSYHKVLFFNFLIKYEVFKKKKYCNRKNEKNSLLLMNVHALYVFELKKKRKNSVCL